MLNRIVDIIRHGDTRFLELFMAVLGISVGSMGFFVSASYNMASYTILCAFVWIASFAHLVGIVRNSLPTRILSALGMSFAWASQSSIFLLGLVPGASPTVGVGYVVVFLFNLVIYVRLNHTCH